MNQEPISKSGLYDITEGHTTKCKELWWYTDRRVQGPYDLRKMTASLWRFSEKLKMQTKKNPTEGGVYE